MPTILFLIGDGPHHNDNHLRLPPALAARGWQTVLAHHQDLVLHSRHSLPASQGPFLRVGSTEVERCDLIWLLGFGQRQSFLDRMQLLRQVDQRRFVNSVDAYVYLHGKSAFTEHMPETYGSAAAAPLIERLDGCSDWVLKPSGASFGRDVSRVQDNAQGRQAIKRMIREHGFAILQRYVAAIAKGETRCLIAGGEIIGCYRRRPAADGLWANLSVGATPEPHQLSPQERALAQEVGKRLLAHHIGFAAVDLVHPYLIEANVANPGGLGTLHKLSGVDPTAQAVDAIIRQCFHAKRPGGP